MALLLVLLLSASVSAAPAPAKPAAKKVAVSEAARRAFVKANAVMGDAKTPEDFAEAAKYYEAAAAAAPSWPDPRFNLAKARELRGEFAAAIASLEKYIALGGSDAREAQDLIYVLETKRDRAGKAAQADAFLGTWYRTGLRGSDAQHRVSMTVSRQGESYRFVENIDGHEYPPGAEGRDFRIVGGELRYTVDNMMSGIRCGERSIRVSLGADKRTMTMFFTSVLPADWPAACPSRTLAFPVAAGETTWSRSP